MVVGGVVLSAGAAGNTLADCRRPVVEAGERITTATDECQLLWRRVPRERERFGARISELPALDAPSVDGEMARAAEAERRFHAEITAARTEHVTGLYRGRNHPS